MLERYLPDHEEPPGTFDAVLLGAKDLPNGMVISKDIIIGEQTLRLQGLSRIGESYSGTKKATEDGSVVVQRDDVLQAIVVDGGTQVDRLESLDNLGITGGYFIKSQVEALGQSINPAISIARNLHGINRAIGDHMRTEHPDVTYEEHSHNVPYGSITGIKIDLKNNTLEVANAGDVFIVTVTSDNIPTLLSMDDVREKDQQTFATTKRLAQEHGVTFRYAMQNRTKDERFHAVVDEMFETMRRGNTGEIRRITGAPNFDVTSSTIVPLEDVQSVILFTDGAIPGGINIDTPDGLREWWEIIQEKGIDGLNEEVVQRAASDPEFEKYPRFGNVDDLMLLQITL